MPITHDPARRVWALETERSAYVLGVSDAGLLVHHYWGARLARLSDYPAAQPRYWSSFDQTDQLTAEEYPTRQGTKYSETALDVIDTDGSRDAVLHYEESAITGDGTAIYFVLVDAGGLRVTLHYRLWEQADVIARHVEIRNTGDQPLTLVRALSAQWHLPRGGGFRLTHLVGRWMDEFNLRREMLTDGVKRLSSRRMSSSHQHSPTFMADQDADEWHGEVYFGALAWSGSWQLAGEVVNMDETRLSVGVSDDAFSIQLAPAGDGVFVTPTAYVGWTDAGYNGASRRLHTVARTLVPHPVAPRQVLYNSWEATQFAVNEASQKALANIAAEIGCELFVMDDGWFRGRSSDRAGLGDWTPDPVKFPHGLTPLIAHVNGLGMDFGLWIEPEMVSADSDLFRQHADWTLHNPARTTTEARNQRMLNLALPDVQRYLIEQIDALLSEHNIRFVKWDMNRNSSEAAWRRAGEDDDSIAVRYVEGLYTVWDTLRQRHPDVTWQSCSGGGGRVDWGMLTRADQFWVSDNTNAVARLGIQAGFSLFYPALTMESWVTDMNPPERSLAFRFHVAMCGVLGIGANLHAWSAEQRLEAAAHIAAYKQVRHLVHAGDQYRLRSPQAGQISAVQYMSGDRTEGVLFVFNAGEQTSVYPAETRLLLRGLALDADYAVDGVVRSALAWTRDGLRVSLGGYESRLIGIRRLGGTE